MSNTKLIYTIRFLSLATAALVTGPVATYAAMDAPKPKIDCSAAENASKAECLPQNQATGDDKVYESAYWKAKNGDYAAALEIAATADNKNDPRILRVTGFATRKLGDVDGGMKYYRRALAINPADTRTRQYMGEAFLTKGDMASATEQLGEIAKACGNCEDYQKLATAITAYKTKGS
jgi:tetratricopeptide (TPR) repeat protein